VTDTRTDATTGLTAADVSDRVAKGLSNDIPNAPTRSVSQIVRANVFTPINLIVAILAALVILAGSPKDALFGGVIVANSVIGVYQELRAKRVLDQLRVVNAPRAHVVRDGKVVELQTHELVLDDVVELRTGAQVVADGVVLTHENLEIDESLLTGEAADSTEDADDAKESPRRRHTIERPTRAAKSGKPAAGTTRSPKTTKRATPSRSRHARPPETEIIDPVAERPRRPRTPRQSEQPPPAEPPRRRSRTSSTREPRKAVPPADRRASYERPERRRRYDDYQPREPHVSNGNGTHHPVSRVRYRGGGEDIDDRAEYRSRPRSSRSSWEYDI